MKSSMVITVASVLLMIYVSCDSETPEIDDDRIIGGWHLYQINTDGNPATPQDSTVYIFSKEGNMQIRSFSSVSASPPDQVFTYSLNSSILRYWNFDYNVNEEKQITLSDQSMTIRMFSNSTYSFNRIF